MRITPAARTLLLSFAPLLALTACPLPLSKRAHRSTATEQNTDASSAQSLLDALSKKLLLTTNVTIVCMCKLMLKTSRRPRVSSITQQGFLT
jgi:hypothetical protein